MAIRILTCSLCISGGVNGYVLSDSYGDTRSYDCAVRPMVEVDLDLVNIVLTGTGTNTDPYSMAKK